jgi:DNA-binding PadR family transcriptional regulator
MAGRSPTDCPTGNEEGAVLSIPGHKAIKTAPRAFVAGRSLVRFRTGIIPKNCLYAPKTALTQAGKSFFYKNESNLKSMRRTYLGEFEEIVLLTVAVLGEGAYGVAITDELDRQTGRSVSLSAVHAALHRLEEKGMLKSRLGEATAERGGRRKRLFSVTVLGTRTLADIRATRNRLWEAISPQTLPAFGL